MHQGISIVLILISSSCTPAGSVPCGDVRKQCIPGQSTCTEGRCECMNPPYSKGDGYFACYTKDQTFAELKNDPILNTFNNEKVPFPYPCRFLFTHVWLQLRSRTNDVIGTCEMIVHAFNEKVYGKFFAKGFDVALRISHSNGTEVELSVRNYGTARNGVNFFTLRGTTRDYLPDGPFNYDNINYQDTANGITVRNYEHPDNNQLVLEALQCGVRVTFVPYDIELLRHQGQVPGLSVAIGCNHEPKFLSNDLTVALPSTDCRFGLLLEDIQFPGLTKEESIMARAFQTIVAQTQPNPNPECASGHEIMRDCSDRARTRAFQSCYWMLKTPRFIRCMDNTPNGEIILSMFNDCVSSFCDGNNSCQDVIDIIISSGCQTVENVPVLTQFIEGQLCP